MITVRDMVKNDEIWTPPEAIDPLLPYLPCHTVSVVWEMCPGQYHMLTYLQSKGCFTVDIAGRDALKHEPDGGWDLAVTNPPWSEKHLFLELLMFKRIKMT